MPFPHGIAEGAGEDRALAQCIVDTVREPVLVLDKGLRVIAASRSFYSAFKVSSQDTQGRLLYALGDGQWDIPRLRVLLEQIIPEHGVMEGYEVEYEFPDLGHRTMCLNARQVFSDGSADTTILLGIEDITERRMLEREKDELLRQKDVLLVEIQHRIANSLQIIASICIWGIGPIEMVPYLSRLCHTLATSMIGDRPVTIKVAGEGGSVLRDNLDEKGGGDQSFEAAADGGVMIVADLKLCKGFFGAAV